MDEMLQNTFFILGVVSATAAIMLGWLVWDLRKKVKMLWGDDAIQDGDVHHGLVRRVAEAEARMKETEPRLALLESISRVSVQKMGFLRFNPFQDTGGDQSFVLVLLDRGHNGVVVSSLYSREGMRLYAKEISGGKSKQPLSEEEKKVLEDTLHKN